MRPKTPAIVNLIDPDGLLDNLEAAYREEYARWSYRRFRGQPDRYELIRNTSALNDLIGEGFEEVFVLSSADSSDAHTWLNMYRGRAAMKCVTDILAKESK